MGLDTQPPSVPTHLPVPSTQDLTHRDLGAQGSAPVEAEHDQLQPMATIGTFEEARRDEVIRAAGREVDATVSQAVAAGDSGV